MIIKHNTDHKIECKILWQLKQKSRFREQLDMLKTQYAEHKGIMYIHAID